MAHLEKLGKNYWKIVLEGGYDPQTGKRKRIIRKFRGTKQEAEAEKSRIITEQEQGVFINTKNVTVRDYLRFWIEVYSPNLKPLTVESYTIILERHLIPFFGDLTLKKLSVNPMYIASYHSEKLKNGRVDGRGGLSKRTVEYHHRVLREALQYAISPAKLISKNPCDEVKPPKPEKPNFPVLDPIETKQFIQFIQDHPDCYAIFFDLYSGLRRGELLGLTWDRVNFSAKTALIDATLLKVTKDGEPLWGTSTKNGRKRVIGLSDKVIDVLKAIKKEQAKNRLFYGENYVHYNLVFCQPDGQPINPSAFSKRVKRLTNKFGKNLRLHDLRHTHISLLIEAGVHAKIIQSLSGHTKISTTMDIYGHLFEKHESKAIEKFDELLENVL